MMHNAARFFAVASLLTLSLLANFANGAVIGISGPTFTTNGGATISGSNLTITTNANSQGRSAWANTPQSISNVGFSSRFTYTFGPGSGNPADGFAFVLQNSAATTGALGTTGGALGYSGGNNVSPSLAVLFNIYAGSSNGMGIKYVTNATGVGGPWTTISPVNLKSGNPIDIAIDYDLQSQNLDVRLRDTVTNQSFATTIASGVNLPVILGGNTAYVGFTGGTGGENAQQVIGNFSFVQTPEPGNLAIWSCVGLLGLVAGWSAWRGKLKRA